MNIFFSGRLECEAVKDTSKNDHPASRRAFGNFGEASLR